MFNLIKILFGKLEFGMGSLKIPPDSRNINITSVQKHVIIPNEYITDLSIFGVEDQGSKPTCVGQSIAKMAAVYLYQKTGKVVKFDAEKLYNQCKEEDGIPELEGTYVTVAAKIILREGIDQINSDSNDKVITGYAFVPFDFDAITQAIYQNSIITIGLFVSSDWFRGIIGRALRYVGGHQTNLYGYNIPLKKLYGINSWGVRWIGQIAGVIDPKVKPGFYVAYFEDIKFDIINIIAFTPIPKEVIDEAKNTQFKFMTNMKIGMTSFEVKKLQERLDVLPMTGFFGAITKSKVVIYQKKNNLVADGIVGPQVRAALNGNTKSFIPQLAKAIEHHEGYFVGSRSYRNNSPANFKSGTLTSYMIKLGAIGVDPQGFAKFPTYDIGFNALCLFLKDACTDKLRLYRGSMTIAEFFHRYAPSSENNTQVYITQVCRKLGVEQTLQIKELL